MIQRWEHLASQGAEAALGSSGKVVPLSELRVAHARIKELERSIGKQVVGLESLKAARHEVGRGRTGMARPGRDTTAGAMEL